MGMITKPHRMHPLEVEVEGIHDGAAIVRIRQP